MCILDCYRPEHWLLKFFCGVRVGWVLMKALSFAAREARRLQAWKLHRQGWSQHAIAELLEVSAAVVSQWLKQVRVAGSVKALRRRPAPGAARRLPCVRWREWRALLRQKAEEHGFTARSGHASA